MQTLYNVSGTLIHPPYESLFFLANGENFGQGEGTFAATFPGDTTLEQLLCEFTGAESILVVDNFTAAANLVLSFFVYGHEVVVGGGRNEAFTFYSQLCSRIMDGGALKVARAPLPDPGCLLDMPGKTRVSLRRQRQGGVEHYYLSVDNAALAGGDGRKTILLEWMEEASLLDLSSFGVPRRLWLKTLLASKEADLVIFPGGGFIGGPALGFIAGDKTILSRLKGMRLFKQAAPEPFKLSLFKDVLELYIKGTAAAGVPALVALTAKAEEIKARAQKLAAALEQSLSGCFSFEVREAETRLFDESSLHLPTFHLTVKPRQQTAVAVWERLVRGRPAIISGVTGQEELYLDLRTLPREKDEAFTEALLAKLQETARSAEAQYFDFIPQIVWIADSQDKLVYLNKPCLLFFNLEDPGALIGQSLQDFLPGEIGELVAELKQTALAAGMPGRKEISIQTLPGKQAWLDLSVSPVLNNKGEIMQVIFMASDITERKTVEEELKLLSLHDTLTGLYNRNYFEEEMKRLNAERHFPISIVMGDIDGLKFINDSLGHRFGDELLKACASILKKTFRASDVVARIGGDEFAIILPRTDARTAQAVLERAEQAIANFNQTHKGLPLVISFGISTGEDKSQDIMEIFKRADDSMYKNKHGRRPLRTSQIIDALLKLMIRKSFLNEEQLENLQQITGMLGRYVGLSEEEIEQIVMLCKVYNIGRIILDDATIFKPGELSSAEWESIRRYPEAGYRIASSLPGMEVIANCILQQRERWDGTGYPQGLKGEEIHLYSRILAVVEAYHAMISPRPYREPLRHEEAVRELQKNRGTQFDPRITDIFLSLVEQGVLN